MIYEIRDYHYEPDRLDQYRVWAQEAVEFLGERFELLGWWLDAGIPERIMGSDPMEPKHGPANVTWILVWEDMEHREREWEALWEDPAWMETWGRHPGFEGYLHMSVRFMDRVSASSTG